MLNGNEKYYSAKIIAVPDSFKDKNNTKKKARALQYALEVHKSYENKKKLWIWHFDEESLLTKQALMAVIDHIAGGGKPIAEGAILYSDSFFTNKNIIPSIVESARPYLCHDCMSEMTSNSYPIHMHGSNLLIRADIEEAVTWSFGDNLAEDQRFGFEAYKKFNAVFGWHGGTIIEKFPLDIKSTYLQRKRWTKGTMQNLEHIPSQTRKRYQILRIITWALGFFSAICALIIILLNPVAIPNLFKPLLFLIDFLWLSAYCIGTYQIIKYTSHSILQKLFIFLLVFILTPIAGFIDCFSALSGILSKNTSWIVTRKV